MKKMTRIFGVSILTASILFGCYPSEDLYYSDLDVAATNYDADFNFDNLDGKICVIFDTVAHVIDEDDEAPEGEYDDQIIAEVLKNMKNTSFDTVYLVKDSSDIIPGYEPHMALTITAWETDVYNYYYYPYYNYWYWGWGWYKKSSSLKSTEKADYYYYPWYPWGGGVTYSYTTGSIILDIVNAEEIDKPENPDDAVDLPIIWTGFINGILSGSESDQSTRIETQIEQVFTQSPYLFN